ncbi:SidA/IucD/PvdA family monooxygenase [Cellulomonas sp. NPDC055163]
MTDLTSRADRIRRLFGPDPAPWVRESSTDHDVVVVGGGQSGLAIGFALRRAGTGRVQVLDAAAPDGTGVWTTTARMRTLRTPKAWPEPEFGHPELSFRAWYEDQRGESGYEELDRIERLDWAAYVAWVEDTLQVPVRHRTRLVDVVPADDRLTLVLQVTAAGRTHTVEETTRSLVLANGVEGTGGPALPVALSGLPSSLVAHTSDAIDFGALSGRSVAVVGAGASAFDAAGTALESGAEVHLFTRRPELIIQGPGGFGPPNLGARNNYHRRPDADRWRQKVTVARGGRSAPLASLERALAHPDFHVHLAAPWHSARPAGGRLLVQAADGSHTFDLAIAGTGFQYDPRTRPELARIADEIALWRDRYEPPAELVDDDLGSYPYLGPGFELLEKHPGRAPWLSRIRVFSAAASMSFGYPVGDVQSLAPLVPRLVDAVGRDLFFEDQTLPAPPAPAPAAPRSFRDVYERAVWSPHPVTV